MEDNTITPNEEPVEELEINELCCAKCGCTNIAPIKKGFSGYNAVLGYIITSFIGAIILAWGYSQNDFVTLYRCYAFTGVLLLLSFFAGTLHMNDIYAVCLRCGDRLLVKSKEKSNKP